MARDFAIAFMVYVALVVVKEGEFLFGEIVWLECHFEAVSRFEIGLLVDVFAFVNCRY